MIILSELFVINNIPSTLSEDIVSELFIELEKGNLKAREELINHNIRLVINQVLNFFNDSGYETKELISIGMIGLIKAVDTFNINLKNKFSSYAVVCIKNEIFQYIRKNKKEKDNCSMNEPIKYNEEGDEISYEDILESNNPSIEECIIDKDLKKLLNEHLESLSEYGREILKLYYGFYGRQFSQREIAKIYNVSYTTINKQIKKNLLKLKNLIENDNPKIYSK